MTSRPPTVADLLDVEAMATIVTTLRWLGQRCGIPAHVTRQATSAIFRAEVPTTPLSDEEGALVGTLVEADTPRLVAIAHRVLVEHLSAAGYPTDPAQWGH